MGATHGSDLLAALQLTGAAAARASRTAGAGDDACSNGKNEDRCTNEHEDGLGMGMETARTRERWRCFAIWGVDPANGRDFIRSEGSGTIWCRIPLQRRRFSLVSFSSACWTGRKSEGTHMAISSPALWRYSEAPEHGLYARRNLGDSTSAKRESAQRAVQEV